MSTRKQSNNNAHAARDSKGRFLNGHSVGVNTRFPPGQSGNPGGSRSAGAHISEWINNLCELSEPELEAIANDRDEPVNRRIAARRLLGACEEGRSGREETAFVCDRTTGKPRQTVEVARDTSTQRILELTRNQLEALEGVVEFDRPDVDV